MKGETTDKGERGRGRGGGGREEEEEEERERREPQETRQAKKADQEGKNWGEYKDTEGDGAPARESNHAGTSISFTSRPRLLMNEIFFTY
jgi:hypothetical protein